MDERSTYAAVVGSQLFYCLMIANPTLQEDCRLALIVKDSDTENFSAISQRLGTGRSAKQCRDRWNNFLRKGIKKGGWTADEERLINDLYSTFGPK